MNSRWLSSKLLLIGAIFFVAFALAVVIVLRASISAQTALQIGRRLRQNQDGLKPICWLLL